MNRSTRKIAVGSTFIGGDAPVLIQSMCSTKTTDIPASVHLINELTQAGAGLVRLAVDNLADVAALLEIRKQTSANLSVDLQENFRLAEKVAPYVDKIRYNPGHLYHLEPELSWKNKVQYLVQVAEDNNCALRIGVNCGSLDPRIDPKKIVSKNLSTQNNDVDSESFISKKNSNRDVVITDIETDSIKEAGSPVETVVDPIFESAIEHADYLESLGFSRFCVSIKDSDPWKVMEANRLFAKKRPQIPLHLGVTEAGMLPWGLVKSQMAMEPLLAEGIGDTLRVSLTVSTDQKAEEVYAALLILSNVSRNKIIDPKTVKLPKLNIISCPSCSRVQNSQFIQLAGEVRQALTFATDVPLTIAIMGCRVNGPGETDDADIGLWCGPDSVNLKCKMIKMGSWPYDKIIEQVVKLVRNRM